MAQPAFAASLWAGLFQLPSPTTRNPPRTQRSRPQETSAKQRVPGWTGVPHTWKNTTKNMEEVTWHTLGSSISWKVKSKNRNNME